MCLFGIVTNMLNYCFLCWKAIHIISQLFKAEKEMMYNNLSIWKMHENLIKYLWFFVVFEQIVLAFWEEPDLSSILLKDIIPTDILQEIQDAFSEFTGMAAIITDTKGIPITKGSGFTKYCMEMTRKSKEGARKCEACDRQGAFYTMQSGKAAVYSCHAGLTDYASPIL